MRCINVILFFSVLLGSQAAFAECLDPEAQETGISRAEEDCDDDGYTKGGDGDPAMIDCDDEVPEVNPGQEVDRCDDYYDNNCDGFYNEGCESGYQRGSLLGGSSCQQGGVAGLLLLPLLFMRRGRRR